MEVLIGVDPHKGSLAVAAIDEAEGELLERAVFPQERAGLRIEDPRTLGEAVPRAPLGRRERRRARASPGDEAGGLGRIGGGCATQTLGAREGALEWQRSQE
jgi:hypothetical protein